MSKFIEKILKEFEGEKKINTILPKQLIHALDIWIEGYDDEAANIIAFYSKKIDKKYKIAPLELYRAVVFDDIEEFESGPRSWADLEGARRFAETGLAGREVFDPEQNKDKSLTILKIKTDPKRIILNLNTFGQSELFEKSYEYWNEKGEIGYMEIDDLTYEKEIIYNQPSITRKDIFLIYNNYNWITVEEYNKLKK